MKKLLLVAMLLLLGTPAFASVGIKVNGESAGQATNLNLITTDTAADLKDGNVWNITLPSSDLVAAGTAEGDATSMTTGDLAVPVAYAYVRKAISADSAFSAGTLANGIPGQILQIEITAVSGSGVFNLTPTTKTGFKYVRFNAAKDTATLLYVNDTIGWVIVAQNSLDVYPL